jgi:hypothetical protein
MLQFVLFLVSRSEEEKKRRRQAKEKMGWLNL